MNFIINPYTLEKHSIFSKDGKYLLKKYVHSYQNGGHFVKVNKAMLECAESFGNSSCAANAFNWIGHGIFANVINSLKLTGRQLELNIEPKFKDLATKEVLIFIVQLIKRAALN